MLGSGIMVLDAVATATTGVRKPHTLIHINSPQHPWYKMPKKLVLRASVHAEKETTNNHGTHTKEISQELTVFMYTIYTHPCSHFTSLECTDLLSSQNKIFHSTINNGTVVTSVTDNSN